MRQISKQQAIDFLIERKLPDYFYFKDKSMEALFWPYVNIPEDEREAYSQKVRNEAELYRGELDQLDKQAFEQNLQIEQKKADDEMLANMAHELGLVLEADFEHFSRLAQWHKNEMIALAFGLSPTVVTWEKLKKKLDQSDFAIEFAKVHQLVTRALECRELWGPARPLAFVEWAERIELSLPAELVEMVKRRAEKETPRKSKDSSSQELTALERQSPYWKSLSEKARQAIIQYPIWKETQSKVQKTGNLVDWLKSSIKAVDREVEILKKVLADFYKELK